MWKLFFGSMLLATSAFAQEHGTAYEALRVIGTQVNRGLMSHVISVIGVDGNPQPARWAVLVKTQAGVREFQVANGRVVSDRPANDVPPGAATIDTAKLNLDSSGAYSVAAHTADTSHVVFDFVNYTLRTDHRGNPTWVVTLLTNPRTPVGTIHIGANKGSVSRVEGMYQGRNMTQVETTQSVERSRDVDEQDSDSDGDENIIKHEIKRAFRRTRRDATEMFDRVQQSFDNFINRRR